MKYPIWTLNFSLLAIATYFSPYLTFLFIYDREALLVGEVWRLLSAHLVHFSNYHLGYDLIAFSVAGGMIEMNSRQKWLWLCGTMAFVISITLFLKEPNMRYYGGLSGIAVGSIIYLALFRLFHRQHYPFWGIILLVTVSKMIVDLFYHNIFAHTLFVPMPLSHISGSLVAVVIFLGELRWNQKNPRN
jgi:rhomboid family GlyGly-CTERM serine protease